MRLLAISDSYIPATYMEQGLAALHSRDVSVEVRSWEHTTLVELQQANLAVEQHGPSAVPLPDQMLEGLDQFDILVVQFAPISRQFLEHATALKIISVLRSGTENIDIDYASEQSIPVLNNPGRNARAVAECTIGLMLSETRNIARSHAALRRGTWQRDFPNSEAIPELHGKIVGLIGLGAVGKLVAHYLDAFGSKVIAFDPYFQGDPANVSLVTLDELLSTADIVSLHARLTPENHHLIGDREFSIMKPTAVLVNTARSGLVDEEALADALTDHEIIGAAIDVFDQEPLAPSHRLTKLANVTLTPHLAGSTVDAFRGSPALMAQHLMRYLDGDANLPIVNGINPP